MGNHAEDADRSHYQWIQANCEQGDLQRTSNSLERRHHGFQSMTGSYHAPIFSFMKHILKKQGLIIAKKTRRQTISASITQGSASSHTSYVISVLTYAPSHQVTPLSSTLTTII